MQRQNITFASHGTTCAGWFYCVDGERRGPCVVMAHGLAGVKEMRLDAYAERFAAAGYHVLVFDYRHFGASAGSPRQLLDIGRQHEDWIAAVAYARGRAEVDPGRVTVWGSSLSGGHVLAIADRVGAAAVISQVPHTDGVASLLALRPAQVVKLTGHAFVDVARGLLGRSPHYVPATGMPGETALVTSPQAAEQYLDLVPDGHPFDQRVAARLVFRIGLYSPGRRAKGLDAPVLVQVGERDTTTPPKAAIKAGRRAPRGTVRVHDADHFEPYTGELFDTFVAEQLAFLDEHLPTDGPS
jgi:pimeloyl-ACP methyl ester carboxylesterase